jgi:Ca-activated chloride channel homolog
MAQSDYVGATSIGPAPQTMAKARQATFRSNANLVLVNVTVLDRENRTVTGLAASDFSLIDDKQPQTIKYFSSQDQPISLAIVIDASGSMAARIEHVRKATLDLVREANPEDDVSVVVVGDEPAVAFGFDDALQSLPMRIEALQSSGQTALWDAMVLSLDQMKRAHYARRAMVVISDGGDNHSHYTETEVRKMLEEADVETYAVGLYERFPIRKEEQRGPRELDDLTSVTGGRVLVVNDEREMLQAVRQIDEEMRNEYVLGYVPAANQLNAGWHRIKVTVKPSTAGGKVRFYAKKGYYASGD